MRHLPKFKHLFFIFLFLIVIFNLRPAAYAAISNASRIIPFQGTLTNSSGNYVADGNYSIVFAIYTVASGGTAAWSETQTVATTNGAFAVNIGANDANGVNLALDTPPYYLGVKVGANAEMSPRVLLAFSPFSFVAKNVDVAPPGVPTGGVMFFNLASCPSGWTELTSARGMYIVGLPASGTLAGTAGTALTNLENRAVGQHTHTGSISTAGAHSHYFSRHNGVFQSGCNAQYRPQCAEEQTGYQYTSTDGSHSHTLTVDNSGSVAGTNAPYIQLLVCQKS